MVGKKLSSKKIPSSTELPEDLALAPQLGGGAWEDDDRLFNPGSLFTVKICLRILKRKEAKATTDLRTVKCWNDAFYAFYPNTVIPCKMAAAYSVLDVV